jgi:hypothetical protein
VYRQAFTKVRDDPEILEVLGDDETEDLFQLRVHIAMAKTRDEIFFERGISESDIERSIKELKLEEDADFTALCH